MDVLNFRWITADESIALAQRIPPGKPEADAGVWAEAFASYIEEVVP